MKTVLKKLGVSNKTSLVVTFFLSLLFMAFFVATLYMLINSAA